MYPVSKLLIQEPPLQVLPSLAVAVGLNEAIVLQQLHYWLGNPSVGVDYDGFKWVSNTYDEWQKNFPFWSTRTLERLFTALEKEGLIVSKQMDKTAWDRRKSYRIDYDVLQSRQIVGDEDDKLSASMKSSCRHHLKVAETTSETTSENKPPFIPHGGKVVLDLSRYASLEPHREAIEEWLAYKAEKKQAYKDTGLKFLLTRLSRMVNPSEAIFYSMASNYTGVFEPLEVTQPRKPKSIYDGVKING